MVHILQNIKMQSSIVCNTQNQRQCLNYRNECIQKRNKYMKPNQTIQLFPNTQIFNPNEQTRNDLKQKGLKYIKQKNPIAIILFAGGYGCRAKTPGCKQFQPIDLEKIKTSLFNIAVKSLQVPMRDQWDVTLYIVCSRKNSSLVYTQIQKINIQYPNVAIYPCYQPDANVLSWNGLQTIFKSKTDKLTYPGGIGAFRKAKIVYDSEEQYTLQDHILQIIKPKYVYCLGVSNILEKGIDYQMIGLMETRNLSCVFKCFPLTIPNKIEQMSLVCVRQQDDKPPAWLVMEHENLKMLIKNEEVLKQYPIWQDNFVFNTRILNKKYPSNPSEMKLQFNHRILINSSNQQLQCLIPELTISYALMRDKAQCLGYMSQKQSNYLIKSVQNLKFVKQFQIAFSPSKIIKKN